MYEYFPRSFEAQNSAKYYILYLYFQDLWHVLVSFFVIKYILQNKQLIGFLKFLKLIFYVIPCHMLC
jgi:hypothetical protein